MKSYQGTFGLVAVAALAIGAIAIATTPASSKKKPAGDDPGTGSVVVRIGL